MLGALSLLAMLVVGVWTPFHTRSLTVTLSGEGSERKVKGKKSWKSILAALTFSSTQYFILKKFLMKHPEGRFDRKGCVGYNNIKCRTSDCNNLRHKMRQLYEAMILEKMCENLPQFILQIINLAPDYIASRSVPIAPFWHYWKLASLLLTSFSLARSCVNFDFFRLDMNPRLFSFYSIGKGWMTLYPQKCVLVVVQSTAIVCKGLTVVYLTLLVNHNFAEGKSGLCSLEEIMMDIRSETKNTCYFEVKVTLLLLLYVSVYYACILMIIISVLPFVYEHSIKNTLRGIESLGSRIKYVLVFLRNLCWMYVMNFVVQHRHFMTDFTNHLSNIGWTVWKVKVMPSILNALGTVAFTVIFYLKGESGFSNIQLGISPLRLVLIGLGIELTHLISLLLMIYRADPQLVQTLSNEKIVDFLIKKGKIDPDVDVTCSRTAKEILHEVLSDGRDLFVYKEDIKLEMIGYSRVLPPETRLEGIAEFHRTFAEAIRKYSRANGKKDRGYSSLNQDGNLPEEEVICSGESGKREKIGDVQLEVIVEAEKSVGMRDIKVVEDDDAESSNEPEEFGHTGIGDGGSLKEAGEVEVKVTAVQDH